MKKNINKMWLVTVLLSALLVTAGQSPKRSASTDNKNDLQKSPVIATPNPNQQVIKVPTSTGISGMDRHPKNLAQFRDTDLCYKDVSLLGDMLNRSSSPSKVILTDVMQFNPGYYRTSPDPAGPTEILVIADTLHIKGKTVLDFSNNAQNRNGYLAIICRVLKMDKDALLQVKLSKDEKNRYRQFSLVTEELVENNIRVTFDQARVLKDRIVNENTAAVTQQIVIVNKPTLIKQIAMESKNGKQKLKMNFSGELFQGTFYTSITSQLDQSIQIIPGAEKFFYKWILSIHKKIQADLVKQDLSLNKISFAKKYLRLIQLQKYNLPANGQLQAVQQQLIRLRKETLGTEACFSRKEYINNTEYNFVSFLSGQAIENILPPDILLVNPAQRENSISLGYFIFDKDNPSDMNLEFDVSLGCRSQRQHEAKTFLSALNEQLIEAGGRFQFTDVYITGPDLKNEQSKVIPLSDNRFKIKIKTLANSSLIFYKLFGKTQSDIYLKGKWKATGSETVGGEFNIPVSLSKMDHLTVQITTDSIRNPLNIPVGVDLSSFENAGKQRDQLIIQPFHAVAIPQKKVLNKPILLPADAISLSFDPDKYGDYFEVMDESDKITQDIMITNNISSIPYDSMSGYLEYVDIQIQFDQPAREGKQPVTIRKNIKLSPSVSIGSNMTVEIVKMGKEYIPVTIRGKAYFENGEYELKPRQIAAGEMIVKITNDMLLVNQK